MTRMDFVAIDFETASASASSACQLGLVVVEDSKIVREACWLIRPPRLYFAPRNIAVHGIRPHQVKTAPSMAELWSEVEPLIQQRVLIAHNARFDISVLTESLAAFEIACPDLEFNCTRALAREAWPGRSRYGLKPLGQWLNISFEHHDALEDARCCAKIAIAVAESCQEHCLNALESSLKIKRGKYTRGKITSPISLRRKRRSAGTTGRQTTDQWGFPGSKAELVRRLDPQTVLRASANSTPLKGKKILVLGSLRGMTPEQTQQMIHDLGGQCLTQLAFDTSYVVACGITLEEASQEVCRQLAEIDFPSDVSPDSIADIRTLSERQFRALLPGGKASTW